MRLREKDKRDVIISTFTGMHDDVYTWGEQAAVRAAVYPMGQGLDFRVYGDCIQDRRLMLYDGEEKISVGMGVSLDGGAPAFRVVSVEAWDHTRAILERIPDGRRT